MSYKYSRGSTVQGDIKAADDTQRDTMIDFGEDQIDFQTSGSVRLKIENDTITTTLPVHISGSAVEGLRIAKGGSDYRAIVFEVDGADNANISVSNAENFVIQNEMNGKDIQFWVNPSAGSSVQAMTIKESGLIGVSTTSPISELDVAGKIAITTESSTPGQPSDGQGYLYSKSDGKIYWRSYDLSETDLTATGGDPVETLNSLTGATGDVEHDCTNSNFFYHTNIAGNFTPNFTNLNMQNNQVTEGAMILAQGGTGYLPNNFKVDNTGSAIYWEGTAMPTASTNGTDTVDLKITRVSNNYNVFARFSTTVYVAAPGGGGGVSIPNNALMFLDASDANSYNGSGTTWTDLSGQNNHGTLVNSPSYNSGAKLFEFTGNSQQHITVPSGFADFTNGSTFFVVADLGAGSNWERFFDFSVGGQTNDAFNFGRNGAGTSLNFQFYHTDPGNNNRSLTSNQISNNTLCSYAVTTDGTNARVYKNGSLVDTVSFAGTLSNVTRTQNYIGRSRAGGNAYYEGDMAVAAIFNRTLSDSEISDLHSHYDTIYSL
jgi:hypothetical protein